MQLHDPKGPRILKKPSGLSSAALTFRCREVVGTLRMKALEMRDSSALTGLQSEDEGSDTELRGKERWSSGEDASGASGSTWFVRISGAVVGILVVMVVVLYVLWAKLPSTQGTNNAAVLTQLLLPASAGAAAGLGVSLTQSGRVQPGAGISIFPNVIPSVLTSIRCADYVGMAAFGNDSYLVAYSSSSISWSTSSLVAVRVGGTRVGTTSLVGPVKAVGYSIFQVCVYLCLFV